MAYIALARAHRPTQLHALVGQAHLVRTLDNALSQGRVHHAYLFCGARGVGKTTTARILARAVNCQQGPSPTACGTCEPCRQILAGHSSDVLEIDGASNTGVDAVRELRESVRYAPAICKTKVYIIDEVHMLSGAAFNALLKTLEEPPAHVLFIFATTEPHKIPATILSRCQRFDLRRVPTAALLAHLQDVLSREGFEVDGATLSSIAREAQGSVRDALSLLDQLISFVGAKQQVDETTQHEALDALGILRHEVIFALWEAILRRDAAAVLAMVADLDVRGHDLTRVSLALAEHARDLSVVKNVGQPAAAVLDRSASQLEALAAQATQRSHGDLQRLFFEAARLAEDVSRAAVPRATFEMCCLRLLSLPPVADLQTLLERLDAPATTPAPASSPAPTAAIGPGPSAAASEPCGPPSGPPIESAAAPALDTAAHSGWQRFVQRVRRAKPAVGSVLEHGRVVRFGPMEVVIAYDPGSFYWDAAREPDTHALLQQLLEEQFSHNVPLQVVVLAEDVPASESLASVSRRAQQTYETTIKRQAQQHVAVQHSVAILDAEIQQVRPL